MKHFKEFEAYKLSIHEREFALRLANDNNIKWIKRVNCPCCGGKNSKQVLTHDRFGLSFEILLCKNCGLIYFMNALAEESVDYYYNKYFLPLTNYIKNTYDNKGVWSQYKFIEPHLLVRQKGNDINILDFGGGTAKTLLTIGKYLNNIEIKSNLNIYEPNKYYHEFYKENSISIIESLQHLESKDKYDLIIMSHVLEHITNPIIILEHLKSLLSENGIIYIEVPGIFNTHNFSGFNFDLQTACPHFHSQIFSTKTLINTANRAGLQQIEVTEAVRSIFCKGVEISYMSENNLKINARNVDNYLNVIKDKKKLWGKNEYFYDVFGRDPYVGKPPSIMHKTRQLIKNLIIHILPTFMVRLIKQILKRNHNEH